MFGLKDGNLESADEALAGIVVGIVVERFEGGQLCYEFLVRLFLQFCTELRVRWNFRQRVSAGRGFDVQSAAAAQNRYAASVDYVLICLFEVTLVLEDVVLGPGIDYVHEVIRNLLILTEVLSSTYVHAPVYLSGVGGEYLSTLSPKDLVDLTGQADSVLGLARGCRAQDTYEINLSVEVFVKDFLDIDFLCRRKFRHRRYRGERFLCHSFAKIAFYETFEKKALHLQSFNRFEIMPKAKSSVEIKNRRASFDYEFIETFQAGMVLTGTEIKSIRAGKASLVDAYCYFNNNELYVKNMHVAEYWWGSWGKHDPRRERKLLLTKRELTRLQRAVKEKGLTIVAVKLYIADNGYAKLLIALARGKKEYDKRASIKEKDLRREMERI